MKKVIIVLSIFLSIQVSSEVDRLFPDPPDNTLSVNFPFPSYSGDPDFICEKDNLRYEIVLNRAFGDHIYIYRDRNEQAREHLYFPSYGEDGGYEYYRIGRRKDNGIELILRFPINQNIGVGKDNAKSLFIGKCEKLF